MNTLDPEAYFSDTLENLKSIDKPADSVVRKIEILEYGFQQDSSIRSFLLYAKNVEGDSTARNLLAKWESDRIKQLGKAA